MNTQGTKELLYSLRGATEPSLLPWLARRADPADLPRLAQAAAGLAATVDPGWPPIADAVAEVLAERVHDTADLAVLIEALPPLAGHLTIAPPALDSPRDRPETLVYRLLAARQDLAHRDVPDGEPTAVAGAPRDNPWLNLLAIAETAPRSVPPLANFSLLAALLTGRAEQHGALFDSEEAYLLPCLDPLTERGQERAGRALELIRDALDREFEWYAAAMAARVAPYLVKEQRRRLRDIADHAFEPWRGHLRELSTSAHQPWPSASTELAAAHPAVTALDRAAAETEPAALADLCRQAVDHIITHHSLGQGWQTPTPDWLPGIPADEPTSVDASEPLRRSPLSDHLSWRQITMSAAEPPQDAPRYVNTHIVRQDEPTTPVNRFQPLQPDTEYALRVGISVTEADSLIDRPLALPRVLPPTSEGHWLEVAATSDGLVVDPTPAAIFLPRQGQAWSCLCPPGTHPHLCRSFDRSPHVLLKLRSADAPGTGHVHLGIYYQGHLLQSFELIVKTDTATAAVPKEPVLYGWVDYTATADFTDIAARTPRTLSVVTREADDGTYRIFWKGGPAEGLQIAATEGQLSHAMSDFREVLLEAHLKPNTDVAVNAYRGDNTKERPEYLADLARMALLGRTLRNNLRATAGGLLPIPDPGGGPSVIQVARVRNSTYVFPWAGVYDLALNDPPSGTAASDWYEPCTVIDRWKQDVIEAGYPHACPHRVRHRVVDTLCPYGFWGLRHAVEVPPSARAGVPLRLEIQIGDSADMVVGRTLSRELDHRAVEAHLGRLTDCLQDFTVDQCSTAAQFGEALARTALPLVYFYCHGLRQSQHAQFIGPVVEIGEHDEISTHQIFTWDENLWTPKEEHWRLTAPLVVINGCHTAEISPEALVSFVDAFSQARSAGVIGTEVMLHQDVAAEAAERFFGHFVGPGFVKVGEAIRRMRLDLLGKGNVMGLAYTAYCSADLLIRRVPSEERRAAQSVH